MPDQPTPPNPNQQLGQIPASVPSVGSFIAAVAMAGVEADSMAKDGAMNRIRTFLTPDKDGNLPSVQFGYDMNIPGALLGTKDPKDLDFNTRFKIPTVVMEPDRVLGIQSLSAKWHLNIHSTAVDESDVQAHESGSGEASVGWGPFKATVKIQASASESEVHKRTTDDTATLDAELQMSQMVVSEGQALVMSTIRTLMLKDVAIIEKLVDAKVDVLRQQAGIPLPDGGGAQPQPQPSGG